MTKDVRYDSTGVSPEYTDRSTVGRRSEDIDMAEDGSRVGDSDQNLSWSELCKMYVDNEKGKNGNNIETDERARKAKIRKEKGANGKRERTSDDQRSYDDRHMTGNMYGSDNDDTREGRLEGQDPGRPSASNVDDVENLYAKVNKNRPRNVQQ